MSEKFGHHFEGARDTRRVLELIRETQSERGFRSEQISVRALEHLKESGLLEEVLVIPHGTKIDRMGIDIICKKASGGYYFINVKSSFKGVEHHAERKRSLEMRGKQVYEIYPIVIDLLESQENLERRFINNVFNFIPSSDMLPPEIQTALDDSSNQMGRERRGKEIQRMIKRVELTAGGINSIHEIIGAKIAAEEKIRQLQDIGFINNFKIITEPFKVGIGNDTKLIWETTISLLFFGKFLRSGVEDTNRKYAEDKAYHHIIAKIEQLFLKVEKNMIQ